MSSSTQQEELQKQYETFASQFSDGELKKFIQDAERIMKRPGALLLAQAGLDATTTEPFGLLDNACGTGPIAACLYETIPQQVLSRSRMLCADFNANLVGILEKRAKTNGWDGVETAVLDAQNTGLPGESFSHLTISFAMHVIPDPQAVLKDTMRLLKPGGIFAFSVMHKDNRGWGPDMKSCFDSLPFEAPIPDPIPMAANGQLQWTDPEGIRKELQGHGFKNIHIETIKHIVHMDSAEHYLKSYGMMKNWMMNTYWTEESRKKAEGMLDEHMLKHLREVHGDNGWDQTWTMILTTCEKP